MPQVRLYLSTLPSRTTMPRHPDKRLPVEYLQFERPQPQVGILPVKVETLEVDILLRPPHGAVPLAQAVSELTQPDHHHFHNLV